MPQINQGHLRYQKCPGPRRLALYGSTDDKNWEDSEYWLGLSRARCARGIRLLPMGVWVSPTPLLPRAST